MHEEAASKIRPIKIPGEEDNEDAMDVLARATGGLGDAEATETCMPSISNATLSRAIHAADCA